MVNETSGSASIRRVAIIGSGLSGLTAGQRLKAANLEVSLFEKSRGPGGRLASKRLPEGSVDIGAQYFTIRNPGFGVFLDHYAGSDSYCKWPANLRYQRKDGRWEAFRTEQRYVGVPRMTAISRQLSQGLDVFYQMRISRLASTDDGGWEIFDDAGESKGQFDAVIITIPPAQARDLLQNSNLDSLVQPFSKDIADMQACWTVAARFEPTLGLDYDGFQTQSEILQWAGNNTAKPDRQAPGDWWVLHGRPDWSDEHKDDDPETVQTALLTAFTEATGVDRVPKQVFSHRWLYARSRASTGPGHLWFDDRRLGIIGDWLSGGRVEGAFNSADSLVNAWRDRQLIR